MQDTSHSTIIYKEEGYNIIGAAMEVLKVLGPGFAEPVYQEALAYEFGLQDIPFEKEKQLKIKYENQILDKYYVADFVCYDKILVECKAINKLISEHESQVINYLNATGYRLGLLLNFGRTKIEIKRIAH